MKKWLLFLFISGCKISSFTTVVAPNINIDSFQSFRLIEYPHKLNITQPEYDNTENRALIDGAIMDEMIGWGLTKKKDTADILVTYTLLIRDMVDTRLDSAVIYKPWLDTQQDSFNYTEGAFTLIIMDDATDEILAQSRLESVMDRNPQKFKSAIPHMIKKMFKRIEDEAKKNN
jgi:uncharacterized protein DUF4136